MNSQQQAQAVADMKAYIFGRQPLPRWMQEKEQRAFFYSGQVTIVNGASGTLQIQIDDDAHFLVEGLQAITSLQTSSQDLVTCTITDTTTSRAWSNIPLPLRDVFGLGTSPKYLADPNILRPASTLALQFTNNSGSNVTVYVTIPGRKVYNLSKPEADMLGQRLWYQYGMSVPQMSAGTVNNKATLQVYNESDFLVKKFLSQQLINAIIGATAGSESAETLANFQDTSKDQFLFNDKTAVRLFMGAYASENLTGGTWGMSSPFCLKRPWLIRRNGTITGFFDNKANATIAASIVTIEGIRIFSPA